MALSRVVSRAKRLADRLAPGVVAWGRRHKLERDLAARRRPLSAFSQSDRQERTPLAIFFAPEAGIGPHFISHMIVARTLKELGHRVLVVRCFEHLPRCIVMDALSLPLAGRRSEHAQVCEGCARRSLEMVDAYGLDVVDLGQLLNADMSAKIRAAMAVVGEDPESFTFDGVAFGKMANGDVSRILKINNPARAGGAPREHVRQYIETALICYLAMAELCRRLDVSRLVYFNDYAMTIAAAAAAHRAGATVVNLSHAPILNSDRRRIMLLPGYSPIEGRKRLDVWPAWRSLALPPERVELIGADTLYRFKGSGYTVYSPNFSGAPERLFDALDLSRDRRLLVAYTSSQDEVDAVRYYEDALGVEIYPKGGPFRDQFEWLERLIENVEASADLQLVIRIHPREDVNRRDGRPSENLAIFREKFARRYEHVRIVWPRDAISSYDLGAIADLVLISLSSIGLEFARLGVPAISSFQNLVEAPDGIFIEWDDTLGGYFTALRRGIAYRPTLADMAKVFRWFNARFIEAAVDVSDIMAAPEGTTLPPYALPRAARTIEEVVIGQRHIVDINRERLAAAQHATIVAEEAAALGRYFRHVFALLMLGEALPEDYALVRTVDEQPRMPDDGRSTVTVHGGTVAFRHAGRVVTRYLPMAERIVPLAAMAAARSRMMEAER